MGDIQTIDQKLGRLHCDITTIGATAYVDIGTSSTLIESAYVGRRYTLIVNDSDTVIYLRLGNAAIVNQGIRLNPHGGAYEITPSNDYRGDIYGIHGGSGDKRVVVTVGW